MLDINKHIDTILTDADVQSDLLIKTAMLAETEAFAALEREFSQRTNGTAQNDADKIKAARAAESRMAASNLLLSAKQKAMDACYAAAKQKILGFSDAAYRDLLGALLAKHAVNDNAVILAERDKKRISKDFVDKLAVTHKIKLTLSNKTHPYEGGIILEGAAFDKNLTIDALLESAREETESEVAEILFR